MAGMETASWVNPSFSGCPLPGAAGQRFLKGFGPLLGPKGERKKSMDNQNRVLIRRGARSLSAEEIERVGGGIGTTTLCTIPSTTCPNKDGDAQIGECGPHC